MSDDRASCGSGVLETDGRCTMWFWLSVKWCVLLQWLLATKVFQKYSVVQYHYIVCPKSKRTANQFNVIDISVCHSDHAENSGFGVPHLPQNCCCSSSGLPQSEQKLCCRCCCCCAGLSRSPNAPEPSASDPVSRPMLCTIGASDCSGLGSKNSSCQSVPSPFTASMRAMAGNRQVPPGPCSEGRKRTTHSSSPANPITCPTGRYRRCRASDAAFLSRQFNTTLIASLATHAHDPVGSNV